MYFDATEELANMESKIRSMQGRLHGAGASASSAATHDNTPTALGAPSVSVVERDNVDAESCTSATVSDMISTSSLASYSSNAGLLKRINRRLRQKSGLLNDIVHRQTFYAYCLRLLTLFVIALVHFSYIRTFLDTLALLEDYSAKVETKYAASAIITTKAPTHQPDVVVLRDSALQSAKVILRQEVDVLNDYKKNVWMTVAAMCVALSTSCFFLFILPITRTVRRFQLFIIGAIDLISFAALPLLLLMRADLVTQITAGLPESLRVAHRLVSAEKLMNALQCTIHPREKLAFCSDVLVDSVFPVILLKYLVILCVMTLAYIILAYIIDYCLKHWFPPHYMPRRQSSTSLTSLHAPSCSLLLRKAPYFSNQCFPECDCGAVIGSVGGAWASDCGCYGYGEKTPKRALNNKTYLPALLVPMKGAKSNVVGDEFFFGVRPSMPTLLPNPLAGQLSPITCSPQKNTTLVPTAPKSPALADTTATEPNDPK